MWTHIWLAQPGLATGIHLVEARDAAKHPTMNWTAPYPLPTGPLGPIKESSGPKHQNTTEVEALWFKSVFV